MNSGEDVFLDAVHRSIRLIAASIFSHENCSTDSRAKDRDEILPSLGGKTVFHGFLS